MPKNIELSRQAEIMLSLAFDFPALMEQRDCPFPTIGLYAGLAFFVSIVYALAPVCWRNHGLHRRSGIRGR